MELGDPVRVIEVTPLEEPVPGGPPALDPQPEPEPLEEPAEVPA